MRRRDDQAERGSTLPFVLLCWLLAALMVFGAIAASDAFLEQQAVQSVCDGAALAAAESTDQGAVYTEGVGTHLPLTRDGAQRAVARHLALARAPLDAWSAETDGTEVTPGVDRRPTWSGSSAGAHIDVSGSADPDPASPLYWKCYRYRVFETTIPLRNWIWKSS